MCTGYNTEPAVCATGGPVLVASPYTMMCIEHTQVVDGGQMSELLHRVYAFVSNPSGSELADLHLSLRDVRHGLRQHGQPFNVALLRIAQFVRQAGLLPRAVSRYITNMIQASTCVFNDVHPRILARAILLHSCCCMCVLIRILAARCMHYLSAAPHIHIYRTYTCAILHAFPVTCMATSQYEPQVVLN